MSKPYNVEGLEGKTMGREDTTSTAQAGLWRHPESGEEAVTLEDPLFGNPQSEAFKRLGFVRVGDAPEGYVKNINDVTKDSEAIAPDTVKGIMARINQLESINKDMEAELAKQKEEARGTGGEAELSGDNAKVAAAEQINARPEGGTVEVSKEDAGVVFEPGKEATPDPLAPAESESPEPSKAPEKSLKDMNKTDLLALVETEQVEGVTESNTNKEIVAAIEAKRSESENK